MYFSCSYTKMCYIWKQTNSSPCLMSLCLFTGACRMYVVWSLCVSVCVALPRCPGSLFKWGFSVRCPAVREISLLPSCADDGLRLGGVNWPPHLLYRCHLDSSRIFSESVVPLRSRCVLQPNSVPFSVKLNFQLPTYGSSGKYSQPFTFFTFYVTALFQVVLISFLTILRTNTFLWQCGIQLDIS